MTAHEDSIVPYGEQSRTLRQADVTGMRFGRLLVLGLSRNVTAKNETLWVCRCDCGRVIERISTRFKVGKAKSCGCLARELTGSRSRTTSITHGCYGTTEYQTWAGMISRCCNLNGKCYPRYGGRGIRVCDLWRWSFPDFLSDVGPRPSPDHSLDRIDNDGHYCQTNCRWATHAQQARNRKTNRVVSWMGRELTIAEWAEITGLRPRLISERLARGIEPGIALTAPAKLGQRLKSRGVAHA